MSTRAGGLPARAAAAAVLACLAAGCAASGAGGHAAAPRRAAGPASSPGHTAPGSAAGGSAGPGSAAGGNAGRGSAAPGGAVPVIGRGPRRLARQLTTAERVLSDRHAAAAARASQAFVAQLACLRIALHPRWARAVTMKVAAPQRAAVTADIAATSDLVALTPPQPKLPPWRIIPALAPAALRADYRAAQAATGVGWPYLAAINFVETDFGRIAGPSTAGAQGPMQFLPATWAIYGHGSIHRPRNAIFAAARFLAGHGAPTGIAAAVHAYNPSWRYVDAVLRYARRMRADPQAFTGYYRRQVVFRLGGGWVLLPAGYGADPAIRPVKLHI